MEGVLYRGLNASVLRRLDAFEGNCYRRELVTVRFAEGKRVQAHTYVFKPEFAHLLGKDDWDADAFLRKGKAHFMARYVGFDAP